MWRSVTQTALAFLQFSFRPASFLLRDVSARFYVLPGANHHHHHHYHCHRYPPLPSGDLFAFCFFCTRFITAIFLVTGLIPDSGDNPAPYFMHLALPFFAVKGVLEVGVGKLDPPGLSSVRALW